MKITKQLSKNFQETKFNLDVFFFFIYSISFFPDLLIVV